MTEHANNNQRSFVPATSGFFDHFYIGTALLNLTSIIATALLPNRKVLPFCTAFLVIEAAVVSMVWKQRDIAQINKLTQSANNFEEEKEQLKMLLEKQSKEIEGLKNKLQTANTKSPNYTSFQAKKPNKN